MEVSLPGIPKRRKGTIVSEIKKEELVEVQVTLLVIVIQIVRSACVRRM